ncbi:MAG: BrnT family toxin [Proteobacteria bacterium]|nr:BrnT family toxin [Pseudomonadota bacterium]
MTSWDESKRRKNIKVHGLDFEGSEAVWDNFTVTREDLREDYGEKRMVTFGLLNGEAVVLVHIERNEDMHVISLRKAEKYEARYYFETAEEYFRKGR